MRAAPGTGVAAVIEEAGYADLPILLRGEIPEFVRFGRPLRPAILLAGRLFPDFDPWDVVPKRMPRSSRMRVYRSSSSTPRKTA